MDDSNKVQLESDDTIELDEIYFQKTYRGERIVGIDFEDEDTSNQLQIKQVKRVVTIQRLNTLSGGSTEKLDELVSENNQIDSYSDHNNLKQYNQEEVIIDKI